MVAEKLVLSPTESVQNKDKLHVSRIQLVAFAALVLLCVSGTALHWLIPPADNDWKNTAMSFAGFLATLVGFAALTFQLKETERAIQESSAQPALRLEVLAFVAAPCQYVGQGTHKLVLHPTANDASIIGTRCAFRVVNEGSKPGSYIYLTFDIRRTRWNETPNEPPSRINVSYTKADQHYGKAVYSDASYEWGYQIGWTMQFPDRIIAYPDLDRPVVAEFNLSMSAAEFESDYEIHYRVTSYEGNKYLTKIKRGKKVEVQDQIYKIGFELEAKH